jgi:hypothetical protein
LRSGTIGTVDGFIAESGRLKVKIGSEVLALRIDNLTAGEFAEALPAGTLVSIHGLKASGQHNGLEATVTSFNADTDRHNVRLPDGRQLAVKRANLAVTSGGVVPAAKVLMPTGGTEGTSNADEALGGAYTSMGADNASRRRAAMRSASWGRSFNSRQVLAELSSIENALQALQARAHTIESQLAAVSDGVPRGVASAVAV